MNDKEDLSLSPDEPMITRRKWRVSLVWLVPAVAAVIGLSMLVHAWMSAGPKITITFQTATGLEAGKTAIKYKDVTVGLVSEISLSDDSSHVIVKAELEKSAQNLARQDTRFWVVRPRVGMGGVSGIDTLLSGAYIEADAGKDEALTRKFTGLETPPTVIGGASGRSYILETGDLGSLDAGSPVYYRHIQVGRVASYRLADDGEHVQVQIFVDTPYNNFVKDDTRFWNASGIDVSMDADGFKLKTQSVATIVSGGVAFGTPEDSRSEPAKENAVFALAQDEKSAFKAPDGFSEYMQMRFEQPLYGLSEGAPVRFAGIDLGRVVSMHLDYDAKEHSFPTIVGIEIFPQRLGKVMEKLPSLNTDRSQRIAEFLAGMVNRGLRAQARSANLLTGQLYIAVDFHSNTKQQTYDQSARPLYLPTIPGGFDKMQEQVAGIVDKLDRVPFDSIGKRLDSTIAQFDQTLSQINGQVLPQATRTLEEANRAIGSVQGAVAADSPLQQDLGQTLRELQRSSRSIRSLTDVLGRHPESLLRGLPSDPRADALPVPTENQDMSATPRKAQ